MLVLNSFHIHEHTVGFMPCFELMVSFANTPKQTSDVILQAASGLDRWPVEHAHTSQIRAHVIPLHEFPLVANACTGKCFPAAFSTNVHYAQTTTSSLNLVHQTNTAFLWLSG